MKDEISIVAGLRSAIGNFNGGLSTISASKIGAAIIKRIIESTGINSEEISEVIMGQVLTGGCGQNPARQAAKGAGLPDSTVSWIVNQVCGSGLWSVALGCQSISCGISEIVIAGGQESMSQAPHAAFLRNGIRMGNANFEDLMIKDGLTDVFFNIHMGLTAEAIAEKYSINKEEQDKIAYESQLKASRAQKAGKFVAEIVPIKIEGKKESIIFEVDEFVRHNVDLELFTKLRPAFKKENGTVTAGNSSGINDGAAAVALMKRSNAERKGLKSLAIIKSFAVAGVDPMYMGIGPVPAVKKALALAGWDIKDIELIEANEAFASQAAAVNKLLEWNTEIVNVNGGAIALGHPIGASGARVLVTLIHEMHRRGLRKGLATLCIGGGMGIAMCIENPI